MARKSEARFAIGVDYGTNSVRALVVDLEDGNELATHVYNYPSGERACCSIRKIRISRGRARPITSTAFSRRSAAR